MRSVGVAAIPLSTAAAPVLAGGLKGIKEAAASVTVRETARNTAWTIA
jgi:hypothetical protein